MSQISHFNLIRPATSCGFRNKNVINQELVESDELKKFRSSFPNLPGFSKHSSFRPQSPKVSLKYIIREHFAANYILDFEVNSAQSPFFR